MTYLYLDFETRSRTDLEVAGLDNYAKCPSTRVLMLGWCVDDAPVQIKLYNPYEIGQSDEVLRVFLHNPSVIKVAWNVSFERAIFKHVLNIDIPIEQWRDPLILARSLSLPGGLGKTCDILHIAEDQAKIKDGKKLIDLFCYPNGEIAGEETATGVSDGFNAPRDYPEEWEKMIAYCRRDVEIERTLCKQFLPLSFPEEQWQDWFMDQRMNERGIPINVERARKLLGLAERYKKEAKAKLNELTGLENANSQKQLLPWLQKRGYPWGSINKAYVDMELKNKDSKMSKEAAEVLTLRRKSNQSSYKKLESMVNQVSSDGRLRYQFNFMGAGRTGRWSAGGVQVQNLPRPIKQVADADPKFVFDLIDLELYEEICQKFDGSTLPFVASCIRMMIQCE